MLEEETVQVYIKLATAWMVLQVGNTKSNQRAVCKGAKHLRVWSAAAMLYCPWM